MWWVGNSWCTHLLPYEVFLFMSNPLCIIALSISLDYNYLELLKLGIYKTLETRSWRYKVVPKVVHLIREDERTTTNENTWVPRIPGLVELCTWLYLCPVLFYNFTCIHVNTLEILNTTCILISTSMTLQRLECTIWREVSKTSSTGFCSFE